MGSQVSRGVHTEMPEEGHMVGDHVHMLIKIPPKFSVAVARQCGGRKRDLTGEKLWTRGYAVSTVGFEEEQVLVKVYLFHLFHFIHELLSKFFYLLF